MVWITLSEKIEQDKIDQILEIIEKQCQGFIDLGKEVAKPKSEKQWRIKGLEMMLQVGGLAALEENIYDVLWLISQSKEDPAYLQQQKARLKGALTMALDLLPYFDECYKEGQEYLQKQDY